MSAKNNDLRRKLGIMPDQKAYTLNAPLGYIKLLLETTPLASIADIEGEFDCLQAFYTDATTLKQDIGKLKDKLTKKGQIWICWPKKTSSIRSDLNDKIVRKIGLEEGLVDVKIAAIDENWSALKFVYRLRDR